MPRYSGSTLVRISFFLSNNIAEKCGVNIFTVYDRSTFDVREIAVKCRMFLEWSCDLTMPDKVAISSDVLLLSSIQSRWSGSPFSAFSKITKCLRGGTKRVGETQRCGRWDRLPFPLRIFHCSECCHQLQLSYLLVINVVCKEISFFLVAWI